MSPTDFSKFDMTYYTKSALAGGICCGFTHGAVCPVDVVKTRIQLEPQKYNQGMVGGFRQVIAEEGVAALSTGLGATAVGYFIQGWFKFGGVEFFKIQAVKAVGDKKPNDMGVCPVLALLIIVKVILVAATVLVGPLPLDDATIQACRPTVARWMTAHASPPSWPASPAAASRSGAVGWMTSRAWRPGTIGLRGWPP